MKLKKKKKKKPRGFLGGRHHPNSPTQASIKEPFCGKRDWKDPKQQKKRHQFP
jgi:hypothetical protein